MKRKVFSLLLAAVMALGLCAPALAEEAENVSHWYDAAVAEVTARGIMVGTGSGFAPEGTVTRAMVFQTLYNMEGRPAVDYPSGHLLEMDAALEGVTGHWWEDAALWAYQTGLTNGTGGTGFAGDRPATRAEIVTILHRYAQWRGEDVSIGENTNIRSYDDAENVPSWAVAAFQWAVGSGTVRGKSDALLAPTATATRAELAQILVNYTDLAGQGDGLAGRAVKLDKYGDVCTSISAAALERAGVKVGDVLHITLSGRTEPIAAPYVTDSAEVALWQDYVTVDEGAVYLCTAMGDFATAYGVGSRGDSAFSYQMRQTSVTLSLAEPGGYADELALRGLTGKRSDSRADYRSDAAFANFRAVKTGNLAPGVLYRAANPIDPTSPRAPYADALLAQAGVKTVVNMADCWARGPEYEGFEETSYAAVHAAGGVVYLNMGADMYADVGRDDLKNALDFMAERDGPYLIHSGLGRDRAGHLVFLLEALMGANIRDIVADYMLSYENLYGVRPDSEAWWAIAEGSIEKEVIRLLGAEDIFSAGDLAVARDASGKTGLERAAEDYLIDAVGLTREQVDTLKVKLATPVSE